MALTLEHELKRGLMIPIVSSGKRREYVPVGSTAASMPPTFSAETTGISLRGSGRTAPACSVEGGCRGGAAVEPL